MRTVKNISNIVLAIFMIACFNMYNSCGNTPLQSISNEGETVLNDDCHDKFVKTVGAYSFTKLGLACSEGDLNTVKSLVEKGACKSRCTTDEIYEYDLLYTAILFNHGHIAEYLLHAGEPVNRIYDENGMTLLTLACINNQLEIAQLLLGAGADVDGGGNMGGDYIRYPLLEAVRSNNLSLVKLLIENNADITVVDMQEESVFTIVENWEEVSEEMKTYVFSLKK